jgi:regulator of protease activity HflC (stomatin/prohibitin superfamily)
MVLGGGLLFLFGAVGRGSEDRDTKQAAASAMFVGVGLCLVALLWVVFSSLIAVPPTHAAILRNNLAGTARYVGPGWRWINPIVEVAQTYDMRNQEYQIGHPNKKDAADNVITDGMLAVDAASNSPGLPVVYLNVTARVRYSDNGCPGTGCDLVYIEMNYGQERWAHLVVDRMEMNAREIAGNNAYNYVGTDREGFAADVKEHLQSDMDGLAIFEFVGIPWYDFTKETNDQLDLVAERQREMERREQDIEIAKMEKQQREVQQDQAIMVAEKVAKEHVITADGEKKATIIRAEAQQEAAIIWAEGERQKRLVVAQGEAEALDLVGQQLADNPELTEYKKWTETWSGDLPNIVLGDTVPLFEIKEE